MGYCLTLHVHLQLKNDSYAFSVLMPHVFSFTGSDRSCSINNGGCEQNCTTLEGSDGFLCHCQDGFTVSDVDATSCVDVDECATFGSNNFPQNCLNVKVTCFLCQCTCVFAFCRVIFCKYRQEKLRMHLHVCKFTYMYVNTCMI